MTDEDIGFQRAMEALHYQTNRGDKLQESIGRVVAQRRKLQSDNRILRQRVLGLEQMLKRSEMDNKSTLRQNKTLKEKLDGAYTERAHLVALISSACKAGIRESWREWPVVVLYPVNGKTWQWSWHINPRDMPLFSHLPKIEDEWDGTTTDEKYRQMDQLTKGDRG